MTVLYTIGHSNHEADALMELFKQHNIKLVVDVRSSPYSRFVPQANRETLARYLELGGIAYRWLGDRLGGKPDGLVADYDQLRASPAFQQGIVELLALAAERRTAILCSEGDYRSCHRHRLIAPALVEQAVDVVHIQPDGTLVEERSQPRQLALF